MNARDILIELFKEASQKLQKEGISSKGFKEISYGIQFSVIRNQSSFGVVRIFRNNKGVIKYDYSQIKDDLIKQQLQTILEEEFQNIVSTPPSFVEPDIEYPNIGTDESGKGDYFGPLVTASVWVNRDIKNILDKNGIKDSKKISDSKISKLAQVIKGACKGKYVVIEIPPNTYNDLYAQFKKEGKSLNVLLAWSHAKAMEELLQKVDCNLAISDQFADEKVIINKLQEKGRNIKLIQEHKAEKYTSVAAASILARERFLEKLKKVGSQYSMDFSKGASNKVIEQARDFVNNHGEDKLKNVAKLHFKTTERVYE